MKSNKEFLSNPSSLLMAIFVQTSKQHAHATVGGEKSRQCLVKLVYAPVPPELFGSEQLLLLSPLGMLLGKPQVCQARERERERERETRQSSHSIWRSRLYQLLGGS